MQLAERLEDYNNGFDETEGCYELDVADPDDDELFYDEDDFGDEVCTGDEVHPHGEDLADDYDVPYEEIMEWFCEGYDFDAIEFAYEIS